MSGPLESSGRQVFPITTCKSEPLSFAGVRNLSPWSPVSCASFDMAAIALTEANHDLFLFKPEFLLFGRLLFICRSFLGP
jgi:hypothetical protein